MMSPAGSHITATQTRARFMASLFWRCSGSLTQTRRSSQTDAVTGEMFVFDGADDGSLQCCVRLQNSLRKSRAGTGSQADPMRQFGVCFLPNFGFTDSLKSHFACCQIKTLLCNQNTKCCFASLLLLLLVSVQWSN